MAQTINLLNGHDVDYTAVGAGEIQTHVILGLNPGLINSRGYSWTGDYVTVTGDLCADLLSNIASEQRAKVFKKPPSNIKKRSRCVCNGSCLFLSKANFGSFDAGNSFLL